MVVFKFSFVCSLVHLFIRFRVLLNMEFLQYMDLSFLKGIWIKEWLKVLNKLISRLTYMLLCVGAFNMFDYHKIGQTNKE